jgi:hypothetical protein
MEFLSDGLSAVATLFAVAMVLAGVMKLFQIHTALLEIKDALNAGARPSAVSASVPHVPVMATPMVRPTQVAPVQAPDATAQLYSMGSGEDMLRALDAQMKAEEAQAYTPEIVDPR